MSKIKFLDGTTKKFNTLISANLRRADLTGTDLRGAILISADLRSANLRRADLTGTDLKGADLRGANLTGASLRGTDLKRADLRGANIDFSALPLSCKGLDLKVDERIAKQLMFHVLNIIQCSNIDIKISKILKKWVNESHIVTEHKVEKLK